MGKGQAFTALAPGPQWPLVLPLIITMIKLKLTKLLRVQKAKCIIVIITTILID
jgi:hypothetical protein